MIAPPLAGNVIGSADASFVVAEWKDAGGRPDRRAGSLRFIFITTTMRLGTSWKARCVFAWGKTW
jgi:hypothetical protein